MAIVPSPRHFDILSDTSSDDDDFSLDSPKLTDPALHHIPVSDAQNRQSSVVSNPAIDSLIAGIEKLRISTEAHESSQASEDPKLEREPKQQSRRRLSRPPIAANTFEVLETVPENEPRRAAPICKPAIDPTKEREYPQLPAPGDKFSDHPLVQLARRGIPSAKEQLAQHREGWFQGILSVKVPIEPSKSVPDANPESKQVHFGLNILAVQNNTESEDAEETAVPSFDILIAPLVSGQELRVDNDEVLSKGSMALAKPNHDHLTPFKGLEAPSSDVTQQLTPTANSLASSKETVLQRSPLRTMGRIEDSVDALDKLEEQLEAFDEVARFRQLASPGTPGMGTMSAMQSLSVPTTEGRRSTTPQPKRTTPVRTSSTSVRVKSSSEPRRSVRKSASMIFLDPPSVKNDDKAPVQAPLRKSSVKTIASLLPPKQPPKSAKKPTIPTFELPGDEVARKLKEKREARASTQVGTEQAIKPTVSSLRRAKSAKPPTRPNFELPGEAISRRKREEREAQLKAQEEEERKRREFKARPIRSGGAPSTFPRETVASRARQGKIQLTENYTHHSSPGPNKSAPTATDSTSRSPLSRSNNQTMPRGRELHPEPLGLQSSRGTSSSSGTGSGSGQRGSVSTDEVQHQRLRGQEIYKRDNSWSGEREREKREREALAKLAREEASERSRQQSREWAAKQAKKRMTIASVRDIMA
ncbi:hypothetical protein GGR52DRAFT_33908 [Hypoxylon sp. FL1284]|nr:hypothetical protein GGR52DRAFT_33908 [Hypoxylon sp. FL1284]